MMRKAVLALGLLPLLAQAGVYKCVDHNGNTSFSQQPCPPDVGTTTQMRHLPVTPQARQPEPPEMPPASPGTAAERYRIATLWVLDSYPLLDPASPQARHEAIREFNLLSRDSIALGEDPGDAVIEAARQVAARYAGKSASSPSRPARPAPAPAEQPAPQGLRVIGAAEDEDEADDEVERENIIDSYYQRRGYPSHYRRPERPRPYSHRREEEEEERKVLRGVPDWR